MYRYVVAPDVCAYRYGTAAAALDAKAAPLSCSVGGRLRAGHTQLRHPAVATPRAGGASRIGGKPASDGTPQPPPPLAPRLSDRSTPTGAPHDEPSPESPHASVTGHRAVAAVFREAVRQDAAALLSPRSDGPRRRRLPLGEGRGTSAPRGCTCAGDRRRTRRSARASTEAARSGHATTAGAWPARVDDAPSPCGHGCAAAARGRAVASVASARSSWARAMPSRRRSGHSRSDASRTDASTRSSRCFRRCVIGSARSSITWRRLRRQRRWSSRHPRRRQRPQ